MPHNKTPEVHHKRPEHHAPAPKPVADKPLKFDVVIDASKIAACGKPKVVAEVVAPVVVPEETWVEKYLRFFGLR